MDDEDVGLIDFYSAQADLLLCQYRNFNHLLGETSDWTPPGALCEELLKDLLRKSLPSSLSVDKGFVYGRDDASKKPSHSPEVDIIIHDSSLYRPIYRMADFVVVEADAVRGCIQVKRSLDSATLAAALSNIEGAIQHIEKHKEKYFDRTKLFFGVVGFQGKVAKNSSGKISETYPNRIGCSPALNQNDASWKPDFIGAVDEFFLWHTGLNLKKMGYQCFDAVYNQKNIFVQALLCALSMKVLEYGYRPKFSFPKDVKPFDYISLFESTTSTD